MNIEEMKQLNEEILREVMKIHDKKQYHGMVELNEQLKKLQQTMVVKLSLLEFAAEEIGIESSIDEVYESIEDAIEKISIYRRALTNHMGWLNMRHWWIPDIPGFLSGFYEGYEISDYGYSEYGDSKLHLIRNNDNDIYQFFGSYKLDQLLEQCEIGDYLLIGYFGKRKLKNGNYMKKYKVSRRTNYENNW